MKRGTPRHPKVGRLLRALGLDYKRTAEALGYLELLWHFTAEYAPQGDVGKHPEEQIEGACHWYGRRGRLIEALTTSDWLYVAQDTTGKRLLLVHDWHDHADDAVRKKLQRAGLHFLTYTKKVTGQNQTTSPSQPDNGSLPTPSHAKPEPLPEPVPLPLPPPPPQPAVGSYAEFPETAHALRESYPATDDVFVIKMCGAVQKKILSTSKPLLGEVTDSLIADAVRTCRQPQQISAGLFLQTVPQCVLTWLTQGKTNNTPTRPLTWSEQRHLESAARIDKELALERAEKLEQQQKKGKNNGRNY